jgi:hypothetical protein
MAAKVRKKIFSPPYWIDKKLIAIFADDFGTHGTTNFTK